MNRPFLFRSVLLAVLLVALAAVPLFAQSFDGEPAAPDPSVAHMVEPGVDSLIITWQTQEPARGWVLYGPAPGQLSSIAAEAEGATTDHRVVISGLAPDSGVYYLIAGENAPSGKQGAPWYARTNDAPAADPMPGAPQVVSSIALGVSLVAPADWSAGGIPADVADGTILALEGPQGNLTVTRQPNPDGLSPEGWFERTRGDYDNTLAQPVGLTQIGGSPALIIGQPETCRTQAMLVALVAQGDSIVTLTWFEAAARPSAPEAAQIFGSLSFGADASVSAAALEESLVTFPAALVQPDCGAAPFTTLPPAQQAAIPTASKCAGAAMYLPGPGPDLQPWSCFSYDPICGPYNPTSVWGSYFKLPHRGIDLGGEIGVTPVYATYSGTAYKYYASNIRISFDGLYTGKSVWMAHMASQNGLIDYRRIVNGQKVTAGQFIGYSGYYNTSGDPPHLHISYVNNSTGTESWPSLDPTKFLSAQNMVWYEGWNFQTPLECSAPSADLYEPDNFTNLAPLANVYSGDQRHDFHAPGDEDYVRFTAVAGQTYYIHTLNLDPGNDTILALLSSNGTTVLAENDDHHAGTLASRIQWKATTSGTYYVRVRHFSFRGYEPYRPQVSYTTPVYGANTGYTLRIRLIMPNIILGRPALSTTYDYQQGLKAPRGNDGNLTTRWSSAIGAASPQWWWADTGSIPFDRVIIRWESAHAGKYYIGWSNDNLTYSGYTFIISAPGAYSHSLVALRTAKYVGIRMEQTAPLMNNYSFYEAEVYRTPPAGTAAAAEGDPLIELVPQGSPVTVVREGMEAPYSLYLPAVGR